MKIFPLGKNSITLSFVGVITIGFFVAGLFEILDYFIVKALLFTCFGVLLLIAISYALKNDNKKNRPED
ncbi:hypothetical protein [uncultured Winogradskyella sp.]|uniref:hypothetical protein n=1 Tax=uncultured Winogradskyella sp. TaxID=395353 RepID=UPI0026316DE3|nr:hypothetical protein [uncultured Winogradskyella sp.]